MLDLCELTVMIHHSSFVQLSLTPAVYPGEGLCPAATDQILHMRNPRSVHGLLYTALPSGDHASEENNQNMRNLL